MPDDTCSRHDDLVSGVAEAAKACKSRSAMPLKLLAVLVPLFVIGFSYSATVAHRADVAVEVHKAQGNEFQRNVLDDLAEIKDELKRLRRGGP
jgi:hypothetical protein